MNMTITPEAADALKQAMQERDAEAGPHAVRVVLAHRCGCGSAKFQMGFSDAEEDDNQIDLAGLTLVVDPFSAEALEGARLEVVGTDNLIGPRFNIVTPGGGGCGCGGGGHQH